jgi:hypothetical protein
VIKAEEGCPNQGLVETRLLVLLAGAVRHKKPDKIVFVKEANMDRRFQDWSYADDLLPQLVAAIRSTREAWSPPGPPPDIGNWSSRKMRPIRRPSWHLCLS